MARISTANMLTSSRFVLSPVFAVVFYFTAVSARFSLVGVILLWVIFAAIEASDVLDGMVARRQNSVSDIGKILDPFADVVSKVTYFVCLLSVELVPLWFLLIFLYRELGIILVRMILFREGIALAARSAGKIKTWFYAMSAGFGLVLFSIDALAGSAVARVPWRDAPALRVVLVVLLAITAALAVGSFAQYLALFARERRSRRTDAPSR